MPLAILRASEGRSDTEELTAGSLHKKFNAVSENMCIFLREKQDGKTLQEIQYAKCSTEGLSIHSDVSQNCRIKSIRF